MSHYITAEIDKEEIALSYGSNHKTIYAACETGFNIYGLYEAGEYHNGMSGSGELKKVTNQIGGKAYLNAVAWALSLKQSFPEKFNQEIKEILQFDENFNNYIFNDITDEKDMKELVDNKCEYHAELNEETIERSFRLFYGVLFFTFIF